jgi:hypothetical protein
MHAQANTTGLRVPVLYSMDCNTEDEAMVARRPIAVPVSNRDPDSRSTMNNTVLRLAPRARRIPISRVRRETEYNITP